MKEILEDSARRAISYLEGLDGRKVIPDPEATAALSALNEPLPSESTDPAEVLRLLDEFGSPATMAMAGRRFFGFVIGGSLPVTLAANWLAGAWDQNSAYFSSTPSAAAFEAISLRWMLDLLGLPSSSAGGFVTGTTVAHVTALAAARHAVLSKSGWNVEADGLFGAPPVTMIVGEEAHPTLFKALGIIGFGRERVTRVPVDKQGRMRPEAMPDISGPAIVCVQAGNVNTGAFDPFSPIIEKAHQAGAWVHVDGAFGLWAAAAPSLKHLTTGMTDADSWATDGHKWLNVPYDSGLAFVRDEESLRASMALTAAYLPSPGAERNPSDYVPELSRRARGVEVWAALRMLGQAGLAELIERNCRQARRFAEGLKAAGFEILNDVVLNQVLVSFGPPEKTKAVIARIQDDGTCWAGITQWQGHTAMRISVSSWATTDADVERSLEAMVEKGRE